MTERYSTIQLEYHSRVQYEKSEGKRQKQPMETRAIELVL